MNKPARAAAHLAGTGSRATARIALLCLLAVVLAAGSAAATAYSTLQGNITQANVDQLLGTDRPSAATTDPTDPNAGRALNILVLGSDVRTGAEAEEVEGMRADTTMLFHISADRSRVEVVSIPRDTLVDMPSCTVMKSDDPNDTYETGEKHNVMFNAAFSYGGADGQIASAAACSMRTVEAMTDIYLDGFVVVDFTSFKTLVNALGGVPMYFDEDMVDTMAGLNISAGCRLLHGDQALALARARYQLGDGSDISRIGRQQELVTAMIKEIMEMNLLTNATKLYKVLDVATASLTTSEGFGNISNLVGLANSLKDLSLDNVTFVTMPWQYEGARVRPTAAADDLWKVISEDHPFTVKKDANGVITSVTDTSATSSASASGSKSTGGTSTSETTSKPTSAATVVPSTTEATTTAPVCTRDNAQG
ncbi:MAG: LCP family protein [Ancrocorticia sp.]|nr:LCP family protein [Ancrocorticia sp.]